MELTLSSAFIVRVHWSPDGSLTGTVERARTGEKQRFDGIEAIGELIARMLRAGVGGAPSPEPIPAAPDVRD